MKKVAVIGCGKMGGAILAGLSDSGGYDVYGIDRSSEIRSLMAQSGYDMYENPVKAPLARLYIISVKPQDIESLLCELGPVAANAAEPPVFVSIAAGIRTDSIKGKLKKYGAEVTVIRVMPNTPAVLGKGISAVSAPAGADPDLVDEVRGIFDTVGVTVVVEERLMDAVTAVSGSGPAYIYYVAELMEKFASEAGIDPETSHRLAAFTIFGAGYMMVENAERDFSGLRRDVTSPGGTTEAAFALLGNGDFEQLYKNAMRRAMERSAELSGESDN